MKTLCPSFTVAPKTLLRASVVLTVVTLSTSPALFASQRYHPEVDPEAFPLPGQLEPAVDFWKQVFSTWTTEHEAIHDEVHLDVVYDVLDFTALEAENSPVVAAKKRRAMVKARRQEIQTILRALGAGTEVQASTHDVERIRALWADKPGGRNVFVQAAGNMRSQRGLRDTMAGAIEISGMFMPGIERAMKEHGVPIEARCMPFVESMFNYKARSKVGASGAWQFTAATGRLFLRIDSSVDERSDVLLAADGAARLLASNYERLEAWPLALTAYNHGTAGIARAVRKTGTRDMGVIATTYTSRTFGFASRNFYPSFLAALIVYLDRDTWFPDVVPLPELQFEVFDPPRFVSLPGLSAEAQVDMALLEELNPALSRQVLEGGLFVPPGYPLRVPPGTLAKVTAGFERLDARAVADRQSATHHRVRAGQTLGAIARQYGTTVSVLQQANNLPRADRIYVGQRLVVPQARAHRTGNTLPSTPPPSGVHVVSRGETLQAIAIRYGLSVSQIAAHNELANPNLLKPGQRIAIPRAGSAADPTVAPGRVAHHVVRPGETLVAIARSYGTSVDSLRSLNQIRGSLIRVGQKLQIPAR